MKIAPAQIENLEQLTRYIFYSKQFTASTGKVRYNCLLPMLNKDLNRNETSVFRSSYMGSNREVWEIGDSYAGAGRKPCKAKAVIATGFMREQKLDVIPETSSHFLHAVIIKWPSERNEQMQLAKILAKEANLGVR